MATHESRLRVRYAETDQMGVVYHANYLIWMEIGRVELVRSIGLNYKYVEDTEGLLLSVIEIACRYIAPARYDEEIVVTTAIVKANSRSIEFAYSIANCENGRVLATGSTRHIWLNREMRSCRIPQRYLAIINTSISEPAEKLMHKAAAQSR
jgi:acyl-CoA thioester hydrolase